MKKKYYIIKVCILLLSCNELAAQQENILRFNYDNQFINNPAATAPHLDLIATGFVQKPFTGVVNSPTNSFISLQVPLQYWNLSLGGALESQQLGVMRDTRLYLSYAYKMKLGRRRSDYLAIGISGQLNHLMVDGSAFTSAVDFNDPRIELTQNTNLGWNVGMGVMYSSAEWIDKRKEEVYYQLGLSTSKVILMQRSIGNILYQESRAFNSFANVYWGDYNYVFYKSQVELILHNSNLFDLRASLSALVKRMVIFGVGYSYNGFAYFEAGIETDKILKRKKYSKFRVTLQGGIPLHNNTEIIDHGYGIKVQYLLDTRYL